MREGCRSTAIVFISTSSAHGLQLLLGQWIWCQALWASNDTRDLHEGQCILPVPRDEEREGHCREISCKADHEVHRGTEVRNEESHEFGHANARRDEQQHSCRPEVEAPCRDLGYA